MSDYWFGFCMGGMATALFWWGLERLHAYLRREYPDSPGWPENRRAGAVESQEGEG